MFIQKMEGSWLQHPFWRRSFLLTDPKDLARLKASDVPAVLVDDERSIRPDPLPMAPPAAAPVPAAPRAPSRPSVPHPALLERPCTVAQEYGRATRIVAKSRRAVMTMFGDARLGNAVRAGAVAPLVDEIASSVARNPAALIGIVRLKSKDEYTYMHSVAVCALMISLARAMELDDALIRDIGMAGLLHDIGKMAVPEALLNKPGRLSDDEFATIRSHPERGHALLAQSGEVPDIALDVCLHHHEKMDGTGYPHGLAGPAISLHARMGAICDVYDAITSARCYKSAWAPTEAIQHMLDWQGHFDEPLLGRFVRSLGIYPVGMLVRLRSNRLGVVIDENRADLTRPRVRAFYSIPDRAFMPPEELIVSTTLKGDQIVGLERPEHWNLGDWEGLRARLVAGEPIEDARGGSQPRELISSPRA